MYSGGFGKTSHTPHDGISEQIKGRERSPSPSISIGSMRDFKHSQQSIDEWEIYQAKNGLGAQLEDNEYINLYKYFRINKLFVCEEEKKFLEPFVVKGIP